MRSMKLIAALSATSAALAYAGIPVEYKQIVAASLGVVTMLLALYNVLRYGPLVQGIERRAAARAVTKASHTRTESRTSVAKEVEPTSVPKVKENVVEEVEHDAVHHRIAISRSTTARPPRARRSTVRRSHDTEQSESRAFVTMLPVEESVAATDEKSHA